MLESSEGTKSKNILIVQTEFLDVLNELKSVNVSLPKASSQFNIDLQTYSANGQLTSPIGEICSIDLNPKVGIATDRNVLAYDESILKFSCLEGTAYLTSHSLIYLGDDDYIPTGYLTFYFYTKSKNIAENSKYLRYSSDPDMDSKRDYVKDKIDFLVSYTPPNSLLLIDGPLIAGDVYTYMIRAINKFLERNILPVFFVKNSSSNMVIDSIDQFSYKYNSDMHWSYKYLKKGQRTNYFKYADRVNPNNAKIFSYIKGYDISPQRVELHIDTFNAFRNEIDSIHDMIYYMLLVQGDKSNPQIRPIAIAEKYAREFIKLTDINKYFFDFGLVPTINQERFGW